MAKVDTQTSLAKPLSVLKPPLVAAGGIFMALAFLTGVWAVAARIPERVYGTAALQNIDSRLELKSSTEGTVIFPIQKKSGTYVFNTSLWPADLYKFIKDPSRFTRDDVLRIASYLSTDSIEYTTEIRSPLYRYSGGENFGASQLVRVNEGDVLARIENDVLQEELLDLIYLLRESNTRYTQLISLKEKLLSDQQKLYKSKTSMVAPIKDLFKKGFTSEFEVLRTESDALGESISINTTESAVQEAKLKLIADESNLRKSLYRYISQSFLFAYDKGSINSFRVSQWSDVASGTPIIQLKIDSDTKDYIIPVAINQVSATTVGPGMKAILTPLGFNASEVGGIEGTIVGVEPDPENINTLAERLGSPGLATLLAGQSVAYIAYIRLRRDHVKTMTDIFGRLINDKGNNKRGGFKWNNKSTPPLSPRDGFLLSAQITTRNRSPIEMLIPNLREVVGISTPHKFQLEQAGQKNE